MPSDFTGGNTRRLDGVIVKNADIVFVVMEQPCMHFAKNKIVEVAEKIQSSLADFNSIRYGVIGFHGVGVHNEPHFHTGDYQVNFDLAGLRHAVSQLDTTDPMESAGEQDPLAAINFAAFNYPFRPATMKTIVLWTCADCGQQANYYDTQTEMMQRGIQLHVLSTERIQINAEHEAELMGFDAVRMFTTNGDKTDLRQSLSSPHDACTVLAQETNGTVWTVADQDTALFTVPSETIAQRIQSQHLGTGCIECECDSHELAPRTVCYPCDVPTPVSLSGNTFFNMPYVQLRNTFRKAQDKMSSLDVWMI